jgi:ubiquinone biosynthesis protein
MGSLKRFWQLLGYTYFCAFEFLSSLFGVYLVTAVGYLLFYPYRELLDYPPPVRLRVAFERLGGAFVKVGQLLSTRVDLLPHEFVRELEKLQDRVPPQPLEELLNAYPELKEACAFIEPEPIGSGSVAQVHRAVLKSGKEVAVKVIRPQAERLIKQDVAILKRSVKFLALFVPFFREFRVPQIVGEIERMLLSELDLTAEAAYLELFRKFSREEPSLFVPAVIWEYSSKKVLVTEFVKGRKLTEFSGGGLSLKEREELAKRFVHVVHRTIFELGVFHGDLHPGNVFLLPDGRIALVDFGIVGRLSPDTLTQFFLFSVGVMNKDPDLIVAALKKIGALPKEVNETLLKREILIFLDKYYNRPLSQIDAEQLFYEELSAARRFKIVLPEELVVLMKTIAHTESIARLIYPDFRLPPLLKPYLTRLAPKFLYGAAKRELLTLAFSYSEFIKDLPRVVKEVEKEPEESTYSVFWGFALVGFSLTLIFAPKLLLFYLPAVAVANRFAKK